MTRQELDALRLAYDVSMPSDFIRGCFFSKDKLLNLLNEHEDCSGLMFYIIPDPTKKAKYTMSVEALNAVKLRYSEIQGTRGLDDGDNEGEPCPPNDNCPKN